jgi:ribosomal protein L21E
MKQGDYVSVNPGVHDASMPANRRDGLIVQIVGERKDQAVVMFHNGAFLKFHKSQLTSFVKCSIVQ